MAESPSKGASHQRGPMCTSSMLQATFYWALFPLELCFPVDLVDLLVLCPLPADDTAGSFNAGASDLGCG